MIPVAGSRSVGNGADAPRRTASSILRARPEGGLRRPRALPGGARRGGRQAIARAYVEQFEPERIAVGRDMRTMSPSMATAVIEGAAEAGCDVVDIGMVGTEMTYFAVDDLGLDGGIMVTASHNPKEYTGMKIVRRGALPVGGDSGLLDVRDRALQGLSPVEARRRRRAGRTSIRRSSTGCSRSSTCRDPAAARGDRRRERDGRRDAPADPRAPAARRHALLLRARRNVPEPRAEPAPAREPRVHRAQDARGGRRPGRRLRRRRRPLLLRRRQRRVRAGRLRHRAVRRVDPREGARRRRSSTTCARAGRCPRRSSARAASRC